jgi:hypothetical protein
MLSKTQRGTVTIEAEDKKRLYEEQDRISKALAEGSEAQKNIADTLSQQNSAMGP